MPIINNSNVNATSTAAAFGPGTRATTGDSNTYIFTNVGANSSVTLPRIESYPATFSIAGGTSTNQVCGFVTAFTDATIVVHGANSQLAVSPAANVLVPSIIAGVLTLSTNITTFQTRSIFVTRIS